MAADKAEATVHVENERVRATQWRFAPGESTGWHRHEYDYVVTPLTSGTVQVISPDGQVSEARMEAGMPYFRRAGVEHDVRSVNSEEFAFVEVGLLQQG